MSLLQQAVIRAHPNTYCPKLWQEIFIDNKGNVYNCCHSMPRIIGNIHRQDLRTIYFGSAVQKARSRSLEGRLGCYPKCNLLSKEVLQKESRPSVVNYEDLRTLRILFGEACNISCVMCGQDHRSRAFLDEEALIRNIDLAPFRQIVLQGGEPFYIKPALKFFDHCASQKKTVNFSTNGLLINDAWAQKISLHSSMVTVSLNGATKKVHEIVNRGSSWERVLANIQRLRFFRDKNKTKLCVRGHFTVVTENLADIPLFIENYETLGFDRIEFGYDITVPGFLKNNPELAYDLKCKISQVLRAVKHEKCVDTHRLKMLALADGA